MTPTCDLAGLAERCDALVGDELIAGDDHRAGEVEPGQRAGIVKYGIFIAAVDAAGEQNKVRPRRSQRRHGVR